MNRPDLTSIAVECLCDRLDDLASGLNYLAETAADPGLKILLMDLSDRAMEILDELKPLAAPGDALPIND
jgi:hypothetical protein